MRKDDGALITTAHGAVKHWECEACLRHGKCPIDPAAVANLRFLIAVRHEIEHQMTKRIDDALSAKVQACVLNFNAVLKRLCGVRCGLDRDVAIAVQLAGIEREQRNMLLRDMDLPRSLLAAQAGFERGLPDEVARDERYAWRVIMVHKNTNSKGAADEMVEFVKAGSQIEGEINRVLVKEMEKRKYRPSDIVAEAQSRGFKRFNQHHHTLLAKERKAKNPKRPFGAFVDIHSKDWRWYAPWLEEVLKHCEENRQLYADLAKPAPTPPGDRAGAA